MKHLKIRHVGQSRGHSGFRTAIQCLPAHRCYIRYCLVPAFCLSITLLMYFPLPSKAAQNSPPVLKEIQEVNDPIRRIELLDEALKDSSIKGEFLSTLYFERALAYKKIKDYFRAVEDFNHALAYTRKIIPPLLEKAHCLILLDQLDEASKVLEVVLSTSPGMANAYVLKGMIYEKEGFLGKAQDEYTRALHYETQSTMALEMRAKLLLREGKPRKALEDANALRRLDQANPEVFLTRARINVKLKDYRAALEDYEKVEALMPGDDKVLEEKVLVFFEINEPGKALEALSGYAVKHPGEVELLVLQARAHIVLKNYVGADRILKLALAKNPLHAPAHLYRGVVHSRNQQPDQALGNLNRAIELDTSLLEAYKERARIFMDIGEPVRAALDLTAAAELDPSDGEIPAMRGLTFMTRSLYDAAIADFTKALESLSGNPRILYDRATAYLQEDEQHLALADLNAVLRVRPDAARALSLRGVARFNLRQMTQAREDFEKAASANPNDALVWNNRGFFHYKMKEYDTAIDCYSRSLKLNPGYKEAQYNLSLALQKKDASELTTIGSKPVKE